VIIDNAFNCKAMGDLVMRDYLSIVWTPCVAHCLNLVIENNAKLLWVKDVVTKVKHIVNFTIKETKIIGYILNIQGFGTFEIF
jgi:hypothetical protein